MRNVVMHYPAKRRMWSMGDGEERSRACDVEEEGIKLREVRDV